MPPTETPIAVLDRMVFGTALSANGYSLVRAIERHECRMPEKSHPDHCNHCYYPWPCPTVELFRALMRVLALDFEDHVSSDYERGFADAIRRVREAVSPVTTDRNPARRRVTDRRVVRQP